MHHERQAASLAPGHAEVEDRVESISDLLLGPVPGRSSLARSRGHPHECVVGDGLVAGRTYRDDVDPGGVVRTAARIGEVRIEELVGRQRQRRYWLRDGDGGKEEEKC